MSRSLTSKITFCPSELIRSRSCPERHICYRSIDNIKPLPLIRQYAGCFPNTSIPMLPEHYGFFNNTLPRVKSLPDNGNNQDDDGKISMDSPEEDIETQYTRKELEITEGNGIFTIE